MPAVPAALPLRQSCRGLTPYNSSSLNAGTRLCVSPSLERNIRPASAETAFVTTDVARGTIRVPNVKCGRLLTSVQSPSETDKVLCDVLRRGRVACTRAGGSPRHVALNGGGTSRRQRLLERAATCRSAARRPAVRALREHWMLIPLAATAALIAVVLLLGTEGWPHRMIGALVTVILTVAQARNMARA